MTWPSAPAADPEVALALLYAPLPAREGLNALFALDRRMGETVQRAREPMLAAIKLAWWRERLEEGEGQAQQEPLLRALGGNGLSTAAVGIVEGWETVLEGGVAEGHAARGRALFEAAARLLAPDKSPVQAGEAGALWGLVDAARSGAETMVAARGRTVAKRWPKPLRPLGMLGRLAARDAARGTPERQGAPRRVASMLWHRITGR